MSAEFSFHRFTKEVQIPIITSLCQPRAEAHTPNSRIQVNRGRQISEFKASQSYIVRTCTPNILSSKRKQVTLPEKSRHRMCSEVLETTRYPSQRPQLTIIVQAPDPGRLETVQWRIGCRYEGRHCRCQTQQHTVTYRKRLKSFHILHTSQLYLFLYGFHLLLQVKEIVSLSFQTREDSECHLLFPFALFFEVFCFVLFF